MPASKKKEQKETPKEEKSVNIKKIDEIEQKIEALFQGMVEMKEDLARIKGRMGM